MIKLMIIITLYNLYLGYVLYLMTLFQQLRLYSVEWKDDS
jgi:hypothetical protein